MLGKVHPFVWIALFFAATYFIGQWRGHKPSNSYVDPADDCAYSSSKWSC